jgi:HKD family nuclease/ssDNA-binding Zn-finger/Zn-ribbon topoisomerase 1
MNKEIADISSDLYYDGVLKSPDNKTLPGIVDFKEWGDDIGPKNPIVLIDTESLNAWVASVSNGKNASRLNYLSASLCLSLVDAILLKFLESGKDKSSVKILIVSPYRPHTKLINLMIKENKEYENIVKAGTVHSFQGTEADIVIFDLVVDEPHWKVGMFFKKPEVKDGYARLINVAITRAKNKLFVIGDFNYCMKNGKESAIGDYLKYMLNMDNILKLDAKEYLPKLYKKIATAQGIVIGGNVESPHNRIQTTGDNYYKYLFNDINNAKDRIVIYSAFIQVARLDYVLPVLLTALERGIKIYIITKSFEERNDTEKKLYKGLEKRINEYGFNLIHKKGMHEKVVLIDNTIVWNGSLNTLSYSVDKPTKEIMERRNSVEVLNDFWENLKVGDLISIAGSQEGICPICGAEMIASEGNNQPFYWRCINAKCFTRSINQPYPYDGEIRCSKCDGPLMFVFNKEPRWKCEHNARHQIKIKKSDLKLEKMMHKIPSKEIKAVMKYLNDCEAIKNKEAQTQISLFDNLDVRKTKRIMVSDTKYKV